MSNRRAETRAGEHGNRRWARLHVGFFVVTGPASVHRLLSPLVRESRVVSLPLGFPTPLTSLRSEALRGDDKRSDVGKEWGTAETREGI